MCAYSGFSPYFREMFFEPKAVKYIVIANVIVFIMELFAGPYMIYFFGLVPARIVKGEFLWTLFTHMFLHADVLHIFFNMYALMIFGPDVEKDLGTNNFLLLYFGSGLAGAILHVILNFNSMIPAIGASGAVFGVMGAYAILFPKRKLGVFVLVGFFYGEAWKIILGFVIIEFLLLIFGGMPTISHAAHIGGFIAGILIVKFMKRTPKKKVPAPLYIPLYVVEPTTSDEEYYSDDEDWYYP